MKLIHAFCVQNTHIINSKVSGTYSFFKKLRDTFPRAWLTHRPDDRGNKHLWNVVKLPPDYTALQPRRRYLHTRRRENLKSDFVRIFCSSTPITTPNDQSQKKDRPIGINWETEFAIKTEKSLH
jgi:hypothetical protein